MREVQASDAKARLSRLLDEVERGEMVIITRRGRRIARIVPETQPRQQEIDEAIADIRRLGKEVRERNGAMTLGEILSLRHAGHNY